MNVRPTVLRAALVAMLTLAALAYAHSHGLGARRPPQAEGAPTAPRLTTTVLSQLYTIDRKYRSMSGPWSQEKVLLERSERPELLWITGYRAEMVAADGTTAQPAELMCHSNLDVDVARHLETMGSDPGFSQRLFTLSQGQLDVRFPDGFGIPILSDEALDLTTQVLNLNHEGSALEVRHKVTIEYVRERELDQPMKALFPTAAYGLALLADAEAGEDGARGGYFGVENPDQQTQGPGCLVGNSASDHSYHDGMGREFTGHWVVPPGRQVNRTLVTHLMRLPYPTRIHYIAVHLHPFAQSLELRDLTTGESLFTSQARNLDDRIGLAKVDALASAEGIAVYPDHEYELVSVYDNTSGEPQDSMAVMYLYLRDLAAEKRLPNHRG
ncbi:MAG: hypothetical protein HC894_02115 [Microcoleus sp. SM1_3_4]|nr:hypothetical protein [Microcoleus sp. SM1_3_4]